MVCVYVRSRDAKPELALTSTCERADRRHSDRSPGYDGVVGPWLLPTFGPAPGLDRFGYAILLPSVDVCVHRVATRADHGFTDEAATRKMHDEFLRARVADRHVLRDPLGDAAAVADLIESAREAGELTHLIR